MKCHINLLFILFYFLLNACYWAEDGDAIEVTQPARIINKSDVSVVLEAKWTDNNGNDSLNNYIIKAGDTLNVYKDNQFLISLPVSECGLYAQSCEKEPIDVRLIFQNDEKKCLLYKGALQENDIRSINSFNEYGIESSVGVNVHLYEYIITEAHLNKAAPCE